MTAIDRATTDADRPASVRLRQGLALLVGAVVFAAVVGPEPDRFYLTPLGLGLVYLAAAAGRRASRRLLGDRDRARRLGRIGRVDPRGPSGPRHGRRLHGRGRCRRLAGMLLARRGFAVDALGLAATIVLAGLALAFAEQWDALVEARAYALLVGVVGLVNAVWGAVGGRAADA